MRTMMKRMAGALLLAGLGLCAPAQAQQGGAAYEDIPQNAAMVISARDNFPLARRMSIPVGKSALIQFPFELRDVLVSDPETVDAVVHSSNRVFLIAKKAGLANAFFFDTSGRQVLSLEFSGSVDLKSLDDVLKRFIPGSRIRLEMAGRSAILSGSVRTPIDAKRATDIACQFVAANKNIGQPASTSTGANSVSTNVSNNYPGSQGQYESKTQQQAAACGSDTKLVINLLTIEGEEQVMLKVTVAEVQRSLLKQFGVNLGATINSGSFSTQLLTANTLPLTSAAGLGSLPVAGVGTSAAVAGSSATCATIGVLCNYNTSSNGSFTNSGVTTSFGSGSTKLTTALTAMERVGLVRTLAEPNLTALSGETAKFLAGGEFPVPIVDSLGKQSVTFKEFGVGVAFTPVVLSEGRISLKIATEVSELTTDGAVVLSSIQIPALKKRTANSTVELPSGGSLAIAGLISDATKQNIDGIPGAKDMPVLGTLFRSRDFIKNETELVVIVTPFIVRPTSPQNLVTPDKGLAPASDLKANFLGQLNRIYGGGRELPPGGLKGDYGFIVD